MCLNATTLAFMKKYASNSGDTTDNVDLSGHYDKLEIDRILDEKANQGDVDSLKLDIDILNEELSAKALQEDLNQLDNDVNTLNEIVNNNGTAEWWTGYYWRDGSGKKAYRKWITGTLPNNKTTNTFPLEIENLDEIFVVSGDLQQSSGVTLQLGFLPNSPSNCVVLQVDKSAVSVTANGTARPGTIWVLVEYCCSDR